MKDKSDADLTPEETPQATPVGANTRTCQPVMGLTGDTF